MELRDIHLLSQLDIILVYLKNNEDKDNDLLTIHSELLSKNGLKTTTEYLQLVLDKLLIDKKIVFTERDILIHKGKITVSQESITTTQDVKEIKKFYFITLDGIYLLEMENGYKGQAEAKLAETKKLAKSNRINNIISGIGGAILGGLLTGLQMCQADKPKYLLLDSLKTQIVHDTVVLVNPKNEKDTSLVRLVNAPKTKH